MIISILILCLCLIVILIRILTRIPGPGADAAATAVRSPTYISAGNPDVILRLSRRCGCGSLQKHVDLSRSRASIRLTHGLLPRADRLVMLVDAPLFGDLLVLHKPHLSSIGLHHGNYETIQVLIGEGNEVLHITLSTQGNYSCRKLWGSNCGVPLPLKFSVSHVSRWRSRSKMKARVAEKRISASSTSRGGMEGAREGDAEAGRDATRWRGRVEIPLRYLPPSPSHVFAFLLHGPHSDCRCNLPYSILPMLNHGQESQGRRRSPVAPPPVADAHLIAAVVDHGLALTLPSPPKVAIQIIGIGESVEDLGLALARCVEESFINDRPDADPDADPEVEVDGDEDGEPELGAAVVRFRPEVNVNVVEVDGDLAFESGFASVLPVLTDSLASSELRDDVAARRSFSSVVLILTEDERAFKQNVDGLKLLHSQANAFGATAMSVLLQPNVDADSGTDTDACLAFKRSMVNFCESERYSKFIHIRGAFGEEGLVLVNQVADALVSDLLFSFLDPRPSVTTGPGCSPGITVGEDDGDGTNSSRRGRGPSVFSGGYTERTQLTEADWMDIDIEVGSDSDGGSDIESSSCGSESDYTSTSSGVSGDR